MKGRLFLDTRISQKRKKGYPLQVSLSKGNRITFSLGLFFELEDWNSEKEEPLTDRRSILFVRKKKVLLDDLLFNAITDKSITLDYVKKIMLGKVSEAGTNQTFFDFADILINEMRQIKDEKGFFKLGNAKITTTAVNQLKLYDSKLLLKDIDYNSLNGFKNWQLKRNKKTTTNTYLRKYRAIYNEAVRRKLVKDTAPFKDIFKNISIKQNRTKKRNISKCAISILESLKGLAPGQQLAIDLWLLQFYFGGQDLKDIYYLENSQMSEGRIYFTRGKLDDNGYEFDLKITSKAQLIIDKYIEKGRFMFPWRKDHDGYRNFIRRVQKNLITIQNNYNEHISKISQQTKEQYHLLNVQPMGGNLTTKVARHTFGTIGSRLFIEPDVLRALMGHERDDVDTIYKDVYPEALRDECHLKIISIDKSNIVKMYVYDLEYLINNKQNRIKKYLYSPFLLEKEQLQDKETARLFKASNQVFIPVLLK
ncbi:phage integrase SAM-like domain-containing protein [Tenacibaculum soleae]|uniref:phage integrase SAM-like domain-containing protein n=1 Tax=Tenacibaculum soleae TaxID=447689 RepID=UPI00230060ED|nr:phage integrase SAM-like domain-containing protein [Tenacibaculum soleae]